MTSSKPLGMTSRYQSRCCAVCEHEHRHQIPLVRTCQNTGTIVVDGNRFCKTHLNAMMRGPIEIISKVGA